MTRAFLLSTFVAMLAFTMACGSRVAPRAETARTAILVGLDAADWLTIDPLIRAGKLPTFARLRASGRTGLMVATPPLVSPMLWTTIATGVQPENHGVLDFMVDLPGGRQSPVGSSQRLAPALWNLFSENGRRVAVVGWWATWPAERVNGTVVSDAVAPQLTRSAVNDTTGLTFPSGALERFRTQLTRIDALTRKDLEGYVTLNAAEYDRLRSEYHEPDARPYANPLAHLAAIVASTRSYARIAETLLREDHPDLLAVYYEAIDTVSHRFVRDPVRGPQVIERAYADADALLRRLAEGSPPETLMIICSDHGFYPATSGIAEDPSNLAGPATAWHRPYGIVAVAMAATLATGKPAAELPGPLDIGSVTPVDIAPTILHSSALPISSEIAGRVIATMLPADAAARPPHRAAPMAYRPPATPPARPDEADAVQRLQALGYVGAARTSLARQNLGESLLRRGKLTDAERELRAVVEEQPRNLAAHLWLAQALTRQNRRQEALAEYERAITLPGGARDALLQAVDLAIAAGDSARAQRLVSAVKESTGAVSIASGALAEAQGDRRSAERAYRIALETDPLSFDAAARLLDLLAASGRARDAASVVERAARLAPDSPRHLALVGEVRLAAHDGVGAETALRRALDLAPDSAEVRLALGRALLMQQKPAEAVAALDPATPSVDRDVLLGSAHSARREWDRAIQHLQRALDAGRSTPDVLNALGWATLQAGRREEAAGLFARSLAARPDQPEIRRVLDSVRNGTWRPDR